MTKTRPRTSWAGPRQLALLIALTSLGVVGCGGQLGVDNGTAVGTVFGTQQPGGSFDDEQPPLPLEDVEVVLIRQGDQNNAFTRRTRSDVDGNYRFGDLPLGQYSIGFDKFGFGTIPADMNGGPVNSTSQIVFVESEGTTVIPDFVMQRSATAASGQVVMTVLDNVTGQPVTNASITIKNTSTNESTQGGVYSMIVPVDIENPGTQGAQEGPTQINFSAEGYDTTVEPAAVKVVPGSTVRLTVLATPLLSTIRGQINISRFDSLFDKSTLTVEALNVANSMGMVDAEGTFTIQLPASNSVTTRQFTLRFKGPGVLTRDVANVVSPLASLQRELSSIVVLDPITVDLVGTVVDSDGDPPDQEDPSGIPDTVTVEQTGQAANIVSGQYTIPEVLVSEAISGGGGLTLQVSAFNADGMNGMETGVREQMTQTVNPVSDGTNNPTFVVPLIRLAP